LRLVKPVAAFSSPEVPFKHTKFMKCCKKQLECLVKHETSAVPGHHTKAGQITGGFLLQFHSFKTIIICPPVCRWRLVKVIENAKKETNSNT
jgi:hypothetical protein